MPHELAGAAARALCRNLYRHVEAAAEVQPSAVLHTAEGRRPTLRPATRPLAACATSFPGSHRLQRREGAQQHQPHRSTAMKGMVPL